MRALASLFIVSLLAACSGGGSGEPIVVFDQGPRTDYLGLDTADMNQDGLSDIVVANLAVNETPDVHRGYIQVMLQDFMNPGTFIEQDRIPVPSKPVYLKLADFNGDSLPDVVATMQYASNEFVVLTNDPLEPGRLIAPRLYATASRPAHVDVDDIDMDGRPDIVLAGESAAVMHLQDSQGNFGAAQVIGPGNSAIATADLDQDGLWDVITVDPAETAAGKVLVYQQRTNLPGSFYPPTSTTTKMNVEFVSTGHLDNNRSTDIASGALNIDVDNSTDFHFDGFWCPLLQTAPSPLAFGKQPCVKGGKHIWILEIADLDGDGRDDVVAGSSTAADPQRIYVYLQSAPGDFRNSRSYRLPNNVVNVPTLKIYAISAEDLNGDSFPDLAVGSSELSVLFQDPANPGDFFQPERLAAQR